MKTPSSLLPSGFADLLAPDAWRERKLRHTALERFRSFGYEEVQPPMLEFENSLLDRATVDRQTFRVLDAKSQRMMGLRADMTPQIARIAASRMNESPLPLRLCYAGTCLRVKGEGLNQSRQVVQAGVECIGTKSDNTLIEIIRCAQETLSAIAVDDLSLDITLPDLLSALIKELPTDQRDNIRQAVEQKDRHTIAALNHPTPDAILKLIDGVTLEGFEELAPQFPIFAMSWVKQIRAIKEAFPKLSLTLDPLEESGFGYYDNIGFSIFSKSLGCEIGRGGHYIAHNNLSAYGFTLYLSPLLNNNQMVDDSPRCLVLADANEETARNLREKGWHTIYSSARTAPQAKQEATEHNCKHILEKEEPLNV